MDQPVLMKWCGTGVTDVGKVRQSNQDGFSADDHLGLWIVADGMGGHAGGAEASRIAIDSLTAASLDGSEAALRQAIRDADLAVRASARDRPELKGMGTTVVVLRLFPGPPPQIMLAHVGDSRAYLLRDGKLVQLTRDHSLMEDFLSRGVISPEEALTHPQRNVLMRAVGIEGLAEPDVTTHPLQSEDLFLLCTDGLTRMLEDGEIGNLLRTGGSREAVCQALVEAANERGGKDNVTVVVISQDLG